MGPVRVEASSGSSFSYRSIIDSGVRGEKTDLGALASKGNSFATVMFWNYHDDDRQPPDALVNFHVNGIPSKKAKISSFSIDAVNSNSYEVWRKMGSAQDPSGVEYNILENAGLLKMTGKTVTRKASGGVLNLEASIQRQGFGLLRIEWK